MVLKQPGNMERSGNRKIKERTVNPRVHLEPTAIAGTRLKIPLLGRTNTDFLEFSTLVCKTCVK